MKNEINILDSLRAFAALSVCMFHFVCTTTGYIKDDFILSFFSPGKYGVQLFFVISGFVIPWSMYNGNFGLSKLHKFILKRLLRLEPPYLVSLILVLVILFLRSKILGNEQVQVNPTVKQVLLHFGYLIPFFEGYKWLNQVYWTLAVEFQYYFFMALLFIPLLKAHLPIRVLIYAASVALAFVGSQDFLPFWLPFFMMGIVLFLYKINKVESLEFYTVMSAILIFSFWRYSSFAVINAILPIIGVLFFSKKRIPILNYFGRMSYSIYLIHPVIGATFINVLSHHYNAPVAKLLVILGGIAITLLSSFIMYFVVEKPSKKWSGSIKYK